MIGKVVWITGASSGIGEHIAYEFAKAGCRLVLSARRADQLERVKEKCTLMGPLSEEDILVLPLDVVKFDTHSAAVATVLDTFNQIDVLVNNAGIYQYGNIHETSLELDRAVYEVNVLGQISLTRAVLPHMYERKQGHIVVMSSVVGKFGLPRSAAYCASKFALHGQFEALRCEAKPNKVSVTMICPGPIKSNILGNVYLGDLNTVATMRRADPKVMPTERCAFLCAAAIAARLNEVWIVQHPGLLLMYLSQYLPTYTQRVLAAFSSRFLNKKYKIDVLVNNAGRSQRAMIHEIHLDVDRQMYELNVLGPISLTRAVLPHMYERKQGHIVVMSSVCGKFGMPNSSAYCASKFALHGEFESLRCEAKPNKVSVTMICPGPVVSSILENAFTGQPGEAVGGKQGTDGKMTTERCAFLCSRAIAAKLDEVWISRYPALLIMYCNQYIPTYTRRLMAAFAMKNTAKYRDP